jgi:hypothetical protein
VASLALRMTASSFQAGTVIYTSLTMINTV